MNHIRDYPASGYESSYHADNAAQEKQFSGPLQQKYQGVPNHIQNKVNNALDMLKATGTKDEMTQEANTYADSVGMNPANRDLLITLKTEGPSAMIKKAFEDPRDSSRQMSYAEMRAMYG